MEIKDYINLDPEKLWDHMFEFSPLYMECMEEGASLTRKIAQMRAKAELKEADLTRKIRENPSKFGIASRKVTLAEINAVIQLNAAYATLKAEIIDIVYENDCSRANCETMKKFHDIMMQASRTREFSMTAENSTKGNIADRKAGRK